MQRIAAIVGTTTHGQRMDIIDVIAAQNAQIRARALEEAAQRLESDAAETDYVSAALLRAGVQRIRALAHADGQQPDQETPDGL